MDTNTKRQRTSQRRRRMRSTATHTLLFVPIMMVLSMTSATKPHLFTRHNHLTFHHKPDYRNLGTRGNRLQWGDDDATYADYNDFDYTGEKDADGKPVVSDIAETDATASENTENTETHVDADGNTFNGSSCKPGNKRPCSPSAMPSAAPSPGPVEPTTPKPSLTLTLPPTTSPTQLPTVPPTWILTRSPTRGPTFPPTPPPTRTPSVSPTKRPTKRPSPSPTRTPTLPPTPFPTQPPSPNPTPVPTPPPTPGPTKEPSPFPTPPPTQFPTPPPTGIPSSPPTALPTVPPSMLPTTAIQTQFGINGTRITECSAPPLGDGISNVQLLAFQYNLYLPLKPLVVQASSSTSDQRVRNATAIMEERIHNGLVEQFLACNQDAVLAEDAFRITAVMSAPTDEVNQTSVCDTSKDPVTEIPTECFVVVAQLQMDAFFPLQRRLQVTLADPQILDSVGAYLNTSMANDVFIGGKDEDHVLEEDRIVQVSFQGFLNVLDDQGGSASGSGVNNAEGVSFRPSAKNDRNVFLLGTAAFGGGALLLFLVALFTTRRNRNRQEAYLRQLDDLAASEVSSQASHILADGRVHLVRDEDYDRFESDEVEIEMELPAAHSNVHFCSSATCPICRHRVVGPTFVSTNLSREELEDLSPRKCPIVPNGRHYEAPDTLKL